MSFAWSMSKNNHIWTFKTKRDQSQLYLVYYVLFDEYQFVDPVIFFLIGHFATPVHGAKY